MKIHNLPTIILFGWLSGHLLQATVPNASVSQAPQSHSRILMVSTETLFPKIMDTLLSNDCIILSANQPLGLIAFSARSEVKLGMHHKMINHLEGTVLIQSASRASAIVRVKLQLNWQERNGPSIESGVQKDADPGWYKGLLDTIEKACPPSSQ